MAKTIGQLTQATTLSNADEFVIEQSGLTKRVAASVVRGGLVNADIDAAAAIAHTKLANITAGSVLLGNASNVPTATAVTGDVTISNAGVTAIGNNKVVTAMVNDAAITPAKLSQPLTLATAQNTTSGTSIDFTGIPSWAKRITVMLNGVSTNGTSNILICVGISSGVATSGYASSAGVMRNGSTSVTANYTTGFGIQLGDQAATTVVSGAITLLTLGSNVWVASGSYATTDIAKAGSMGGVITLGGTLDRIRLTTVNGTDTFDAGTVNIMYEG